MSEPKFTPGPWFPHVSYVEGFCVDVDKPATVEDMRLIRAAPELYYALQELLIQTRQYGHKPEIKAAEHALAKARGESHE